MPNQRRYQAAAFIGCCFQGGGFALDGIASQLNDGAVEGDLAVQCRTCADNTVAADHRRLDRLPGRKRYNQGDHTCEREIGYRYVVARIEENALVIKFDGPKVRPQALPILCRHGGKNPV
jgi:hypothetical protein